MKKFLTTVALVAAFTAGALAMPGDQAEAVQLAAGEAPLDLDFGPLNLDLGALLSTVDAAPDAPLGFPLSYEQYVAMSLEERRVAVSLFTSLQSAAADGMSGDELAMLTIKLAGPWEKIRCGVCKTVIGFFVGQVGKLGCVKVSVIGAAVCQIAGLGPADPLSRGGGIAAEIAILVL